MEKKIKLLQIIYCLIIALTAGLAILSEADFLPVDYIGDEPRTLYWINLYAIIVAFGGMFLCLRLFVFKTVKQAMLVEKEDDALAAYSKWTSLRLAIIALSLWSNTLLYFSTSYTSTPQYCILVTLVSCVFCWPSVSAYRGLRKSDVKSEDESNKR